MSDENDTQEVPPGYEGVDLVPGGHYKEPIPPRGYVVDPRHTPRLTDVVGSFRSENAGVPGVDMARLAPVFHKAANRSLATAHRALDDNDHGVDRNHVNLSPQPETPPADVVRDRIKGKLAAVSGELTQEDQMAVAMTRIGPDAMPVTLPGQETPEGAEQPKD